MASPRWAAHAGLADDLLNFQYDPVACAVALGWTGASIEELPLASTVDTEGLHLRRAPTGRQTKVVADIDVDAFADLWLDRVRAAAPVM